MNKKYLVAAIGAALAFAGASAHALEAKVSGQIARGLMYADDGKTQEMHNVDPGSSTRFRFTGEDALASWLKVGIQWEMEFVSNGSGDVTNYARSVSSSLSERLSQIYFDGAFGRLTTGQGPGAADGSTETDLSGTGNIASMVIGDYAGSMAFQRADKTTPAGPAIKSSLGNLDLEGRYDRLRYDTPTMGGVKVAASSGIKNNFDVKEIGVSYSAKLGGFGQLAAGLGTSNRDTGVAEGDVKTTGGSVSWLAPFGLNVTLARSSSKNMTTVGLTGKESYLKVGYKFGQHAVAVETAKGDDQALLGDEAKMMGIGYAYAPKSWAELFAGGRVFSLERASGVEYSDIKLLTVGTKLKF